MCALSEQQGLFSVDGKFISSEDGATPIEFYNAVLLFPPQMKPISVLCAFFAALKNMLFTLTEL